MSQQVEGENAQVAEVESSEEKPIQTKGDNFKTVLIFLRYYLDHT
jgi:hypothetical protein